MESRAFKVYKMACPKSEKIWKFKTFGELTMSGLMKLKFECRAGRKGD